MYVCMYVYKYSVDIYLLCMRKVRVRWCSWSLCKILQNYITRKLVPITGYRASEFIPCIFGVFKNKIEKRGTEQQQQT